MGRRRSVGVELPEGVQTVRKPNGRTYYYWAPKRSTKTPGARVPRGSDTSDPQFWTDLRKARGAVAGLGTFDRLIVEFKASPEWLRLRPVTQKDYAAYLDRLSLMSGDKMVAAMNKTDVYALRDDMAETPVAANHMLAVLRTLVEWGAARGYRDDNPVIGVKRLVGEGSGATPWPEDGYRFVRESAPADLARMAFLGRATGQRAGDLVRMKPAHMEEDGINVSIAKRREQKHFVPLTAGQISEIRSWGVSPLDYFLKSNRNRPYTATHLNSRWNRWRDSADAKPVAGLKMTIHGLRATKIDDLDLQGASDRAIADEVGISPAMVHRYLRFANKARAGRVGSEE